MIWFTSGREGVDLINLRWINLLAAYHTLKKFSFFLFPWGVDRMDVEYVAGDFRFDIVYTGVG